MNLICVSGVLKASFPPIQGDPHTIPLLLKIYLYGYLNYIQSNRRMEREAQRNIELIWLTGRVMPDFKTIANFRKDNGKASHGVYRQFVVLCQQLGFSRKRSLPSMAASSR